MQSKERDDAHAEMKKAKLEHEQEEAALEQRISKMAQKITRLDKERKLSTQQKKWEASQQDKPVVVGLLVYLALSRSGPFGVFGLLYTPSAMVIAQVLLITPIIAALTCQVIDDLHKEYRDLFFSLSIPLDKAVAAYLWDARYSLITAVLAGFGRAISEVGAVMIVGGNIDHLTRVMTTAIALETSRGELSVALGLGIVLLALALFVNGLVTTVRSRARYYGCA